MDGGMRMRCTMFVTTVSLVGTAASASSVAFTSRTTFESGLAAPIYKADFEAETVNNATAPSNPNDSYYLHSDSTDWTDGIGTFSGAITGTGTGFQYRDQDHNGDGAAPMSGNYMFAWGVGTLTFDFASFPGSAHAFGFDFADLEGALITVHYGDGSEDFVISRNGGSGSIGVGLNGFFGFVTSQAITSVDIQFAAADGVGFDNMTIAVPLPAAAWAGLGLLGSIVGVRKLRSS